MKKTAKTAVPRQRYRLDPRVGGLASAAARKKARDEQVRRKVARFVEISNLADLRFRPALASLARITILLERAYAHLKARKSLLNDCGELCLSIDVFRRLAETQSSLLKAAGLLPNIVSADNSGKEIEAAFERIEAMKRARGSSDDEASDA